MQHRSLRWSNFGLASSLLYVLASCQSAPDLRMVEWQQARTIKIKFRSLIRSLYASSTA